MTLADIGEALGMSEGGVRAVLTRSEGTPGSDFDHDAWKWSA